MRVDVALPVPVRSLFTYEVPVRFEEGARRGARVRVPFGKRTLIGIVVGESARAGAAAMAPGPDAGAARTPGPAPDEVKEILDVLDPSGMLPPGLVDLGLWLAEYYQAPPGEALRLAFPPDPVGRGRGALPFEDEPRRTPVRREPIHVRLAPAVEGAPAPTAVRGARQRAILDALAHPEREDGWTRLDDLRRRTGATRETIDRLERHGLVQTAAGPSRAEVETREGSPLAASAWPTLTGAQERAAGAIVSTIDAGTGGVFLLWGVTGSGKTEVYFAAARRALDRGRGAIFLVPEIGLTPLFMRRVRERFGEQVALFHSRLNPAERRLGWERVRRGEAPLVVGPRSALFAPIERPGLIVVDEEHDPSYKQEETPRYNARDMALVRARMEGATVVLGSATPSVESWQASRSGKYFLLTLEERIAERPMPPVEIIDMRREFQERGEPVVLSSRLVRALDEALGRGEQGIVLLNRRGYAAFALCRACGETVGCPECSVSLVYHRSDETLRCHYCGHRRRRPKLCERCGSEHLVFQGEGTERVVRHLEKELPRARIARLDRDTARLRGAHERILADFESGEADILVGTQMVAKGHDFPKVTVVGVLAADLVLGFPDFRAAERTFQLLTQVAGRAGRGDRPGVVFAQAYRTEHYALQTAARHDAGAFFEKEIEYRRMLAYPPFTSLVAVTVSGKDLGKTAERARDVAARFERHGEGRIRVLGPAIAPIARVRGLYRMQVLLKGRARRRLGAALGKTLDELSLEKGGIRDLTVDVDPLQLL